MIASEAGSSPEEFTAAVIRNLRNFSGGADFGDDITLPVADIQ